MYIEQRLERCDLCWRVLALQYQWLADRPPCWSRDRIWSRPFTCPGCGHTQIFRTLWHAVGVQLKLVPGPEPRVPFPMRVGGSRRGHG